MITIAKDVPIISDPDILWGTPIFTGTRVPVSAMLENLEAGVSIDEFLANFPTVTRDQAVRVLEHFRSTLDDIRLQLSNLVSLTVHELAFHAFLSSCVSAIIASV